MNAMKHRALLIAILGMARAAHAGEDCWVEIYDQTEFKGTKLRLTGPVEYPKLSNIQGQNWSDRIDSIITGPKAEVHAYRFEDFRLDSAGPLYHPEAIRAWGKDEDYTPNEITIGPGQKKHHLGELKFHHNINSLKINCLR
jgi:hypothetical protein